MLTVRAKMYSAVKKCLIDPDFSAYFVALTGFKNFLILDKNNPSTRKMQYLILRIIDISFLWGGGA